MLHLATDKMHLNPMRCCCKTTGHLEANAAGHVHVGSVFALEGIISGKRGHQSLIVVFAGRRGRENALNTAHGEHQSFHAGKLCRQSVDQIVA